MLSSRTLQLSIPLVHFHHPKKRMVALLVIILFCFFDTSSSNLLGVIDQSTGSRVTKPWLEAGFTLVDDGGWTNVQSVGKAFTTNIVILTALPDLGGRLYTQGNATATRIRNIVSNTSGVFFQIRVTTSLLIYRVISLLLALSTHGCVL
jgi:hypothetical protein